MLKRCLSCLSLVLLLAAPLPATAQDKAAQPKREQPSFVLRLRSLDALFETLRLDALKPLLKDVPDLEEIIKEKVGPNGLEGFDQRRPIIVYGKIDADFEKLVKSVVLMVPVTDEQKLVATLDKLGFESKKDGTGLYTIKQNMLPMDVFFRFANRYVYFTGGEAETLAKKRLPQLKEVFPRELTSLVSVTLRHRPGARAGQGDAAGENRRVDRQSGQEERQGNQGRARVPRGAIAGSGALLASGDQRRPGVVL